MDVVSQFERIKLVCGEGFKVCLASPKGKAQGSAAEHQISEKLNLPEKTT